MDPDFVIFVSFIIAIFLLYYFSKLVKAIEKIANKLDADSTPKEETL